MYPLRVGVNWAARTFSWLFQKGWLVKELVGEGREGVPKVAFFEKEGDVSASVFVDECYPSM